MGNIDPEKETRGENTPTDDADEAARERRATQWSIGIGIALVAIILAVVSAFTCSGGNGKTAEKTSAIPGTAPVIADNIPVVSTVDDALADGKFAFVIFTGADESRNQSAINATKEARSKILQIGGDAEIFRIDASKDFYNEEIEKSGVKSFPAIVAAKDSHSRMTVEGDISTDTILNAYVRMIQSS
jgi:RNA 3'-terminal phosphate cyclase